MIGEIGYSYYSAGMYNKCMWYIGYHTSTRVVGSDAMKRGFLWVRLISNYYGDNVHPGPQSSSSCDIGLGDKLGKQ